MKKFDEEVYKANARQHALPFLDSLSEADLTRVVEAFPQTTGDDWWFRKVIDEEQRRRKGRAPKG